MNVDIVLRHANQLKMVLITGSSITPFLFKTASLWWLYT